MYSIEKDSLLWQGKELGSKHRIHVDYRQDYSHAQTVVHTKLDVGDVVMVGVEDCVVVMEEKKIPDLVSSYSSRRLQRQLRHMLTANPTGANVLGLRGEGSSRDYEAMLSLMTYSGSYDLQLDLLKWQILGGYVIFLPKSGEEVVQRLHSIRAAMKPGRHLFSIVAGDDQEARRKRLQLSPTATSLHRLFTGIGPVLAERWAEAAGGDLVQALTLPDTKMKELGIGENVLKQRRLLCQKLS